MRYVNHYIKKFFQHNKNFKPRRNKPEKIELARKLSIEEIERLKISIEKLEDLEFERKITRERLEKLDIEVEK